MTITIIIISYLFNIIPTNLFHKKIQIPSFMNMNPNMKIDINNISYNKNNQNTISRTLLSLGRTPQAATSVRIIVRGSPALEIIDLLFLTVILFK